MAFLRPLACALALLLVPAAVHAEKPRKPDWPKPGGLNPHVLAVLATYPTDGTHGYFWPKTGTWAGNARTLRYAGKVILRGDPKGRCYCCGLTFEVFLQAVEAWCKAEGRPYRIKDYTAGDVLKLKDDWFGTSGDRSTLWGAVRKRGLGIRVTKWTDARPGDFVQLWRHSGSGHSAVFRAWKREGKRIVGITYWSTQASTNGIGERTERFGEKGATVKRDELYLVRIGKPPPKSPR